MFAALAIAVMLCSSQAAPQHRVFQQPNLRSSTVGAAAVDPDTATAFAFAMSTGTGMGTACAGTVPTGTRGETVTFTRASMASCTTPAGLVVILSDDQPRVQSYTGGTQLGLLLEPSRTNSTLRSAALDNAAWAEEHSATAPTVTANACTGPDGAMTADRVQFPATSGAAFSALYQLGACPAGTAVRSFYVKGFSGSGTMDACLGGDCSLNVSYTTTWMRYVATASAASTIYEFGNLSNFNGGVARLANDVCIWGVQCESTSVTSYIPSDGTAVTRAAEVASVALASGVTNTAGCVGAKVYSLASGASTWMAFGAGGAVPRIGLSATTTSLIFDSTNTVSATIVSAAARLAQVLGGWQTSGTSLTVYGDATATGTFDNTLTSATVYLGAYSDGSASVNGWLGNVVQHSTRDGCQ